MDRSQEDRLARATQWLQLVSHAAQIIGTLVVVVALLLAIREYKLHWEEGQQKKREAVTALLLKSVDSKKADDALAALHADTRALGKGLSEVTDEEFDAAEGALINYFWAVSACIKADLCDKEMAHLVLCHDYRTFRAAQQQRLGALVVRDKQDYANWEPLESCQPGKPTGGNGTAEPESTR